MAKRKSRYDLTITFDSADLRDLFRGWLSDGGGEQDFFDVVAEDCNKKKAPITLLDSDYKGDHVYVRTWRPGRS